MKQVPNPVEKGEREIAEIDRGGGVKVKCHSKTMQQKKGGKYILHCPFTITN